MYMEKIRNKIITYSIDGSLIPSVRPDSSSCPIANMEIGFFISNGTGICLITAHPGT